LISGMLTRGKNCEDGVLCAPKLSDVTGGDAVYPRTLRPELLKNVGDFYIDCERMPGASDLKGHEKKSSISSNFRFAVRLVFASGFE
jgi:hypothetical protein